MTLLRFFHAYQIFSDTGDSTYNGMKMACGENPKRVYGDATVHTMAKSGTLQNTDVFISDGVIQRIGKDLPVPQDDAYVFNAEGKPLTLSGL
jgi:dihydroorotase-like cyclic amidohydrolase